MKQKLINILESIGFPVFLQGSLNPEQKYPDTFLTFWNFETPEGLFYDNDSHSAVWGFWVFLYSNDPEIVETKTEQIRKLLKENGFILQGRGEDADSGRDTHTGRMLTLYFMEV